LRSDQRINTWPKSPKESSPGKPHESAAPRRAKLYVASGSSPYQIV